MRRRGLIPVALAPAIAVAATALALTQGLAASRASVAVFPAPGSAAASPRTQISFRGVLATELGRISVRGSRSGRIAGQLTAHSDGRGVSFVPERRLTGGERIVVRTGLNVRGVRHGDFSFRIGRRPQRHAVDDGRLALPPLPPGNFETFRSQPGMKAPIVRITKSAHGTALGSIFLSPVSIEDSPTPDGPMIIDDRGDLVWFEQRRPGTKLFDFKVQRLDGRRVLTWWEGRFAIGWGYGEHIVLDDSYREIRRIRPGNGYASDLHDLTITPQNTALVLAYDRIRRDLRSVGGSRDGVVLDNVVQEIDLDTGLVLFEWHSLGQVAMRDSRTRPEGRKTWDYFHVNSVEVDSDGNLIISARNTCALYKISRRTGSILWRLGGRRSDFEMGPGTRFCFQHDARRAGRGLISLFDNAAGPPALRKASRAIVLAVDERAKTVRLRRAYKHPGRLLAPNQGSARVQPNGNMFVGWGAAPVFSAYSSGGRLLFNGRLTKGKGSYRAVREPWTGRPAEPPRAAAQRRGDRVAVWASWNGATEVARWEVLAGTDPAALQMVGSARRDGFETVLRAPVSASYVAVRALNAAGDALGTSAAVRARE